MPAAHPTKASPEAWPEGCWQGRGEGGGHHTPASLALPGQGTPRCSHKAEPPPRTRAGRGDFATLPSESESRLPHLPAA